MPVQLSSDVSATLGTPLSDLETPAVVIDLDTMEKNANRYLGYAKSSGVRLRSHAKIHKIPELARWQDDLTEGGILCQKLSEVEVMAHMGMDDILLVCPVVGERKLERYMWLSDRVDNLMTCVDCPGNIQPLARAAAAKDVTVTVVLEIDVGTNRTGVRPGEPAVQIARLIDEASHLELAGILGHDGHVKMQAESVSDYEQLCGDVATDLQRTVDALERVDIAVKEVITGSTATTEFIASEPVVTEVNPGRYPFMDVQLLRRQPHVARDDCAATIVMTVVSKPKPDRVIVDAGHKTISMDTGFMPVPKHRNDVEFDGISSEHGHITLLDKDSDIEVGDRLEFILPSVHGTINTRDVLVGTREGIVEEVWDVQARGKDK